MLPRETCASTVSFASCRSCPRGTARPSTTTMELLEAFARAEERVVAAWTRIGLAEVDRQSKWASFVDGRLHPFLHDYVRLQEAEEMAIAAENDQLFREMFFASLRLREHPKSKALAQLVDAVLEQGFLRPCNITAEQQQKPQEKSGSSGWETEPASALHGRSEAASSQREQQLQLEGDTEEFGGSFALPSFVAMAAARGDEAAGSRSASIASRAREEGNSHNPYEQNSSGNNNNRSPSRSSLEVVATAAPAPAAAMQDVALAAVWQLARSMTHQELRRNLESEVNRMNALADARLQQLCLLYKQRALLQLSPHDQAVLRSRYAEKLLVEELSKPQHDAQQQQQKQQLLSSVSGLSSTCGGMVTTPGPSSGRTTPPTNRHSCHSAAKDELDLLSDALPERLRATYETLPLCGGGDDTSAIVRQDEIAGRGTIFEVNLDDVTRFGRRQDLSLARIDKETQDIYAEIMAQNMRMASEADEELQCVEELWALIEGCARERGDEEQNEEAECTKDYGGVPSRRDFMCRLAQLRQEYEQLDAAAEESITASTTGNGEEAIFRMTGPNDGSNNNNHNESCNSGLTSRRATCSSRSRAFSHPRTLVSEGGSGVAAAWNTGGTAAQLPAPLVKLFTARSYAPILSYIVTIRERLQRLVLQRHVEVAQAITQNLTEMYRLYFDKTHDTAYRVTPDYTRWLQENADAAADSRCWSSANTGEGLWQQFLANFTPRNGNDSLRERIADVQYIVGRAKTEVELLHQRLWILSEVEPLLQRRLEIIEQQRAIQEGSRERLLSKKVNMARQLLFEENARRGFARELPKLHQQMEELLRQWNGTCGGESGGGGSTRRLVVHGIDVADLVREFHEDAARTQLTRRPVRSLSRSPPPSVSVSVSKGTSNFVTPQKTPGVARSLSQHRAVASSASPAPRAVGATTPARAPLTGSRLHSAKKSANPASSMSPAPVKQRTAAVGARRHGLSPVPAVNALLRREPRAVPLRSNTSVTKSKNVPSSPGTPPLRKK